MPGGRGSRMACSVAYSPPLIEPGRMTVASLPKRHATRPRALANGTSAWAERRQDPPAPTVLERTAERTPETRHTGRDVRNGKEWCLIHNGLIPQGRSSESGRVFGDFPTRRLRMSRRFWVACVVVMGLSVPSLAGAADKDSAKVKSLEVERIVSAGHEESQVMDHLDVLCNRIGPRLTGSDNLTNACEWVRDRFASFGIENARLESWGEFPVGFNRGPGSAGSSSPSRSRSSSSPWRGRPARRGPSAARPCSLPRTRKSSTRPRKRRRSPGRGCSCRDGGSAAARTDRPSAVRFAKSWKTPRRPVSSPRHPASCW